MDMDVLRPSITIPLSGYFGGLAVCSVQKIVAVADDYNVCVNILVLPTFHFVRVMSMRQYVGQFPGRKVIMRSIALPTYTDPAALEPFLFICDIGSSLIAVMDLQSGRVIGTVVPGAGRRPQHVAVHNDLLAASCRSTGAFGEEVLYSHVVQLFTGRGGDWLCFREIGNGYFCQPNGISISSSGSQVTVADKNHRLCHLSVNVHSADEIILRDQNTADASCVHIAWCEQGQGWLMQCSRGYLLFMGTNNGRCTTIGKLAHRHDVRTSGTPDMAYVPDVGILVRAHQNLQLFPIDKDAIRMLRISHDRLAWMAAVAKGIMFCAV